MKNPYCCLMFSGERKRERENDREWMRILIYMGVIFDSIRNCNSLNWYSLVNYYYYSTRMEWEKFFSTWFETQKYLRKKLTAHFYCKSKWMVHVVVVVIKKINRNEYKYWIVGCFFLFLFFAQKSKFEKKRVKTMQIVNVTNIQKWINDFHLDFCSDDDDDDDRPVFFCLRWNLFFVVQPCSMWITKGLLQIILLSFWKLSFPLISPYT